METSVKNNIATFETNKLPDGLYYVSIVADGKIIENTKLIISNK